MLASASKTIQYFDLESGMNMHLGLPAAYIAGKMMIIRALVGDMNLICVPPSSTPLYGLTTAIDFAAMTPYQVQASMDCEESDLNLITKLIIGGAPVSPFLKKEIQGLRAQCYMTYGMTETITHIAVQQLNGEGASEYFELLDGVKMSLIEGNLVIEADHLGKEKILTTDRVELIDAKQFKWLGRSDFVINSGGIKLHPESIEAILSDLIADPYVVLSQAHATLGQCPILLIAAPEYSQLGLQDLDSSMKLILNRYEIPKKTYFVRELKTTSTGKVKRDVQLYDLD